MTKKVILLAVLLVACSSDGASVGEPGDSGASGSGGTEAGGGGSGGQAGSPAGGDAGQGATGGSSGGTTGGGGTGGATPPDGGGGTGALDGGWTKDCHPNKFLCDVKLCNGVWMEWAKPPIAKRCCTGAYGPCGMDFQDGKGCIPCAAPLNEPKDT